MDAAFYAYLPNRSVFRISGADTHSFLDGLFTVDSPKSGETMVFGGLLTPQGKIMFEFFMTPDADDVLIDIANEQAAAFKTRLSMYQLRANVEITEEKMGVCAFWGDELPEVPDMLVFDDPRLASLGKRALLSDEDDPATAGYTLATIEAYHAHRISQQIPEGGIDYAIGDTFPHDACYDQFSAVDFKKGCYVGQEVVSRMQHRSTARKRIMGLKLSNGSVEADTQLTVDGRGIGALGSSAETPEGNFAIALLRIDKASDAIADGKTIMAGTAEAEVIKPDWASFDWPVTKGSGEAA